MRFFKALAFISITFCSNFLCAELVHVNTVADVLRFVEDNTVIVCDISSIDHEGDLFFSELKETKILYALSQLDWVEAFCCLDDSEVVSVEKDHLQAIYPGYPGGQVADSCQAAVCLVGNHGLQPDRIVYLFSNPNQIVLDFVEIREKQIPVTGVYYKPDAPDQDSSQLVVCDNIECVLDHIDTEHEVSEENKKTAVFFDIDETLIYHEQKDNDAVSISLCQKELTRGVVESVQLFECKAMCLTARMIGMGDETVEQLETLGLSFKESSLISGNHYCCLAPFQPQMCLESCDGVLLTGNVYDPNFCKGLQFKHFFQDHVPVEQRPEKAIFIDNNLACVLSVAQALRELSIPAVCIWYTHLLFKYS